MKRRELLRILGMGAVSAPVVGTKEAARIMGVPLDINKLSDAPTGTYQSGINSGSPPLSSNWWGSPIQIQMEARKAAERPDFRAKYAHMRSWSHSFKSSVISRELEAEMMFVRRMEMDVGGKAMSLLMKELGKS